MEALSKKDGHWSVIANQKKVCVSIKYNHTQLRETSMCILLLCLITEPTCPVEVKNGHVY